ncbi:MAG: hypothetical protein HQ478_08160 [Chloroflexi bacterium]|nr:hypothetical protein [Chloroflexota bacterium]
MTDPAQEAITTFRRWADAFNARDTEAMVAEMHFPHMRLSGSDFQTWQTSDDFASPQDAMTAELRAEGWHIMITKSIDAVQANENKVHLVIRQSRQHADGTEYNGFDTLWIFTRINGKWGVQFRSSFLANAVQGFGASEPKF